MSLHDKLVAIQSDLKAPKGQTNLFGKYKYRSCEDILEALKPLLREHSLVLTLSDDIIEVGGRVYVKATATLGVVCKDERISVSAFAREQEKKVNKEGKETMDHAQITGATSSYARKYALNGLFCIDDTKDADTMDNTNSEPKKIKEDSASEDEIIQIKSLCEDTKTEQAKLYRYFLVQDKPTKEQAQKMLVSLKAKLSKQIDSASQS